ncbi:MAG: acyltransferase family rane protein [Hyphomicrobiales bacterium]|nr:acyltransferase family rane protein [Hyphomicrobiales bacterium]
MQSSNLHYRPEIDGLRAIAIIPVVLFHAGFTLFGGGYIGVDVFFVISGYLITAIIIREVEAGEFTFAGFYERRARRILPALLVVMVCCVPFAWLWMLPRDFQDFSASMLSVAVFASNIFFWKQAAYFETASALKPLMHTWSLAVEEQFYILFPIAILLLWRWSRRSIVPAIAATAVVSLLLCEYASSRFPTFNFYWAITRAWEWLAGSLCAVAVVRRCPMRDNVLSALGLVAIIIPIFWFDSDTPFPSHYALLPVGGASLVLLFGVEATLAARLLSSKRMVGCGLISYSAYLWHQPLFAFARLRTLAEPSSVLMGTLTFVTFALAYLSWRFVEKPWRRKKSKEEKDNKKLILVSSGSACLLIAMAAFGCLSAGAPSRFDKEVISLSDHNDLSGQNCTAVAFVVCKVGTDSGSRNIALIGDSHAHTLANEIDRELRRTARAGFVITGGFCVPLLKFVKTRGWVPTRCDLLMDEAIENVLRDENIRTVVLYSEWAYYTSGFRVGTTSHAVYNYDSGLSSDSKNNKLQLERALSNVFTKFLAAGKSVVVVKSTPEFLYDVPDYMAKARYFNTDLEGVILPLRSHIERNKDIEQLLEGYSGRVFFVDPSTEFCDSENCQPFSGTQSFFRDSNHLNEQGAQKVVSKLMRALEKSGL